MSDETEPNDSPSAFHDHPAVKAHHATRGSPPADVIDYAPEGKRRPRLVVQSFADIEAKPIDWLWRGKVSRGTLTALVSEPGLGKSMVTCDLAARVSTGRPMPDGSAGIAGGASVLIANAEDDPERVLKPRLAAAAADVARIGFVRGIDDEDGDEAKRRPFMLEDVAEMSDALGENPDIALVVIDPVGSFFGSGDSHRDNEVRGLMGPLMKLAADHDVAVVVVMHRRKAASRSADDTVLGSRAFTGVVRQVWHLYKDPEDEAKRLMLPGKCNLAAVASGMSFGIAGEDQHARVVWDVAPVRMTADEAASRQIDGGDDGADGRTAMDEATNFLRDLLGDGPREVKEVEREATAAGISVAGALRRAKARVCLPAAREGFGKGGRWMLELKPDGDAKGNGQPPAVGAHKGAQPPPNTPGLRTYGEACAPMGESGNKEGFIAVGEDGYAIDAQRTDVARLSGAAAEPKPLPRKRNIR